MGIITSGGYSGLVGKPNMNSKVEAKYPALLFKQHLTAYVEKIYGMIRDALKKEISPFLNLCIQVNKNTIAHKLDLHWIILIKFHEQAPRSTRARSIRGSSKNIHSNILAKQQASNIHWQSIVNNLARTLSTMSENYVSMKLKFIYYFALFSDQRIGCPVSVETFLYRSLPQLLRKSSIKYSTSLMSSFLIGLQLPLSNTV